MAQPIRQSLRLSIRSRVLASLLVFGLLPAVAMALLGHWVMSLAAQRIAGQQLTASAEELSTSVNDRLRSALRTVDHLGSNVAPVVAAYSRPAARDSAQAVRVLARSAVTHALAAARVPGLRRFSRMLVCDTAGIVLGAVGRLTRFEFSDADWLRAALRQGRGAVYIGRPAVTDSAAELDIAVPLFIASEAAPCGVLRGRLDCSDFTESLEDAAVGANGLAALVSASGDVLMSSGRALAGPLTARLAASYHPTTYRGTGLSGSPSIAGIAPVPSTHRFSADSATAQGWSVWVERSTAEVLAATHHFGRIAVLIILLAAVIVVFIGSELAASITRPLRDLRDGAHAIGSGRLDARLDLATGDEIEALAADFNRMAERLAESYRGLENRVQAATAALGREKESLQSIIATVGEGLMVLDSERRIVVWNRAAEAMTGYPAAEVVGRHCASVLWAGSDEQADVCSSACPAVEAMASRATVTRRGLTTSVQTRSGERIFVGQTASPLFGEHGEPVGCVVVIRDVTPEKQMDELKSDMISMVSHELRSPLTSIIGFAELLGDSRLSPEDRERFVRIAVEEGRRMSDLVEDFLTVSRLESGRLELTVADADLARIAAAVIALHAPQAAGHKLTSELAPGFPIVRADPERIKRVLDNLVTNAVKYSPQGGTIRIFGRDQGPAVEIGVEDHGIGIRSEDLPRLFHRFQRVNRDATPDVRGTGLGLAICRSIVEEHGGTVRVESEYRRGSIFYFTLPKSGPLAAQSA